MKKTYRLGELFCGPGGLACGALSATSSDGTLSVAHAWANDFDHDSCRPSLMISGSPGITPASGNRSAWQYPADCPIFS